MTNNQNELREPLEYNPRQYGKSFKQWQQFIVLSRNGEDIVYRTPEGDICSPARVKQLVTQAVAAAEKRALDTFEHRIKSDTAISELYGWVGVVEQAKYESEQMLGLQQNSGETER